MRALLSLLAFFTLAATAQAAPSVPRTTDAVAWAIRQTNPRLPPNTVLTWARAFIAEASRRSADPFTMVAIVHNESRFNPEVVDGAGVSVGWGQYRLDRLPECKQTLEHPVCKAKKAQLLVWQNALTQLGSDIENIRRDCRKLTGKTPLLQHWLAAYQGASSKTRVCGMVKVRGRWVDAPRAAVTVKVMRYREWLNNTWEKQRRRPSKKGGFGNSR